MSKFRLIPYAAMTAAGPRLLASVSGAAPPAQLPYDIE